MQMDAILAGQIAWNMEDFASLWEQFSLLALYKKAKYRRVQKSILFKHSKF